MDWFSGERNNNEKLDENSYDTCGLSLYSTRRGFACDSIVNFEIALADGKLVHANARENPHLWTASKGSLNNFGIATSFTMQTSVLRSIWGGVVYYLPDPFQKLGEATVDFAFNEADEEARVHSSAGYGFEQNVATCCVYQTQGEERSPSLQRFTSAPDMIESHSNLRTSTHIDFCKELSSFTKDNVRLVALPHRLKP